MSDLVIHNINISYDESDERVRDFVKYLKGVERKEEMKAYFEKTKNSENNKINIDDKFSNEFTLEYLGGHNCTLKLRGM